MISNFKDFIKENDSVNNVSIYLPTYKTSPDKQQNSIRYKNLLEEAKTRVNVENTDEFFAAADELLKDDMFWTYVEDGLAVLITDKDTKIIKTLGKIPERLVVSDQLHLLPLLNRFEFIDHSYILDLKRDSFTLLHIGPNGLEELETPKLENDFHELFDDKDFEYNIKATDGASTSFHGPQASPDLKEIEREKYFRYIANGLSSHLKHKEDRLIVFGTTENVSEFKTFADGKVDIDYIIDKPLDSFNPEDIYKVIRDHLRPRYIQSIKEELEELRSFEAQEKGSLNASLIQKDAQEGKIAKLYVSTDFKETNEGDLDKIVAWTLKNDGKVIPVLADEIEFKEEIGSINRY